VTACPAAADCNGDREQTITDPIYGLMHQFTGGPPPPAPYPGCGRVLGMESSACPLQSTRCSGD
jgi:hypothetical protein